MDNKNISVIIKNSVGIPTEFKGQLFKLEHDNFSKLYLRCPRNIGEYDNRYENKKLVLTLCLLSKEIIGFRIFDIINSSQVNSKIMVVKKEFRGQKISNLICSMSTLYLKFFNYKYITSWTHVELTVANIMAKYAPFLSIDQDLKPIELILLREFEKHRNKENNINGHKRTVKKFYTMKNKNKSGDANFWVHVL